VAAPGDGVCTLSPDMRPVAGSSPSHRQHMHPPPPNTHTHTHTTHTHTHTHTHVHARIRPLRTTQSSPCSGAPT
jgi:hypothetical protein